jgi:hypothetical protein
MTKKINIEELKARISYEELYNLYVTQNKTRQELLEYYKITIREFERLLKTYKINKNKYLKSKIDELKNKVIELYINQNKTLLETAEILNISFAKVEVIVYNHNIRKNKEELYHTRVKGRKKYEKTTGYSCPFKDPSVREKYKEKTGYDSPQRNPKIKEKTKNTNLEKYGSITPLLNKNIKKQSEKTIFKKYGVNNISQSEIIKDRKRDTTLKRYGVENPFQANLNKEKIKQTNLERYGVENPLQNPKIYAKMWATKKARGTTNTSKPEDDVYVLLLTKFPQTLRNHSTDLYPFHCDFYIPELDLYIEYQGDPSHGKVPYDASNPKHQKILKTWQQRAQKIEEESGKQSRYIAFIDTWTHRDPLKRQTAAANHLNWLEFFTMDQFLTWYNSLS